jgi:hypothetical protein
VIPLWLRRLAHNITNRDEYEVGKSGRIHRLTYRRRTGQLVDWAASEPGDRPNFQPVGGAR